MRTKEEMAAYQSERRAKLKGVFVNASDPVVIEAGRVISEVKRAGLVAGDLPVVDSDEPCRVCSDGEVRLDLEKDLGLDLKNDLGITGWTRDGIFIRPDITIKQVQNIARLIHAKHGRPCPEFRQCGV